MAQKQNPLDKMEKQIKIFTAKLTNHCRKGLAALKQEETKLKNTLKKTLSKQKLTKNDRNTKIIKQITKQLTQLKKDTIALTNKLAKSIAVNKLLAMKTVKTTKATPKKARRQNMAKTTLNRQMTSETRQNQDFSPMTLTDETELNT